MKGSREMRDKNSLPVYRRMGTAFDPPEATTTARAKRVIRTAYCKFTGSTRTIIRAVYSSHDKASGTDTTRTSVIERKPARPLSTGFHTLAEKRAELAHVSQERDPNRYRQLASEVADLADAQLNAQDRVAEADAAKSQSERDLIELR